MLRCRTVKALFDVIPIGPWRAYLIRSHIDACPACQARLLGLEESRLRLIGAVAPDEWAGLRRRLRDRISAETAETVPRARPRSARFLRWAPSAAMVLVLAATGVWLIREGGKGVRVPAGPCPADRFELDYIRVGGRPAGAYIYHPQDADIIIVWAEKTP